MKRAIPGRVVRLSRPVSISPRPVEIAALRRRVDRLLASGRTHEAIRASRALVLVR